MARKSSQKAGPLNEESSESDIEKKYAIVPVSNANELGDPMEKDEIEKQLEQLVFGDDEAFQEAIHDFDDQGSDSASDEDHSDTDASGAEQSAGDQGDVAGVADADLFFIDSGPTRATEQSSLVPIAQPGEETHQDTENPPAWEDSDDERLMVSLASDSRLRKLRVTEAEDMINGKEYTRRLRIQFQRLNPVPGWANPSISQRPRKKRKTTDEGSGISSQESSDDEIDVDEGELSTLPLAQLLQNTEMLSNGARSGKRKLRPEVLSIEGIKGVENAQPSAVTSLVFHPFFPLLLSSGPASTIYLHHISPDEKTANPLVTSLHLQSTPLHTTAFAPDGSRIFFSGRRRYFHIWGLETGKVEKVTRIYGHEKDQRTMERFRLSPCGRYMALAGSGKKYGGNINILDAKSLQWIAEARVESRDGVADFAWWRNGNGLTIAAKNGEISEWDIEEDSIISRWVDEGAVGTSVLALGGRSGQEKFGGDRWVAVGSSSGIVNIYDRRAWLEEDGIPKNPKPTRMLDQLTTAISHLVFSPDGQLLIMSSRWKKDALRIGITTHPQCC
ncbi:MAG: hypothetical protein M1834_008319 [Cirrosporium novae-zelandiae]|nr:MAG: hypothetical protein M1834_008319 [Cirrosporium novae-zelandiae]